MIHADTCFIVDLIRERRDETQGPATQALRRLLDEPVALSTFVASELHLGLELMSDRRRDAQALSFILESFDIVHPDDRFAPTYGRLAADLRKAGTPVATMDLLIATSAIVGGARLVTRNDRDFGRIGGLERVAY